MFRLHRITQSLALSREPLPGALAPLDRAGIRLRPGQVTIVAAQPNDGKSALALTWALQLCRRHGKRTLYFSADTDESDTLRRAAAAVTGHPQSYVESLIQSNWGYLQKSLASLNGGVAFSFETDPTYNDIYQETIAFWEMWGAYPDLIVIDNLMDVVGDNEDEYGSMRDTTKAAKRLARKTGSHVMLLAHCREGQRSDHPPSRSELTGKVSMKPELVLTLLLDDEDQILKVAVVKGRSMSKDPSGRTFTQMRVDLERMQFFGLDWSSA